MLTCSQEQAIKRVQQNDEGGLIIQFLMRSFEDIFRTKKKIDFNQLSRFLNINTEQINRYLILLEKQNMIELEFLNTDISIYWKLPREDQFTLNVFLKKVEKKTQQKKDKIQKMFDYAFDINKCKRNSILSYFGENQEKVCKNCSAKSCI